MFPSYLWLRTNVLQGYLIISLIIVINFAIWKDGETEFDCVKEWCFRVEPYSQDYHNMGAGFFWQLTKHLHEQSENTWEKISKLI